MTWKIITVVIFAANNIFHITIYHEGVYIMSHCLQETPAIFTTWVSKEVLLMYCMHTTVATVDTLEQNLHCRRETQFLTNRNNALRKR